MKEQSTAALLGIADDDFDGIEWHGGRRSDFKIGSWRDDDLRGRGGDDVLISLGGNDKVRGQNGDDIILTGRGNDKVDAGKGDDVVLLGSGNDTAEGGHGDDFVAGGRGDDLIWGGRGRDTISGGDGFDTLVVKAGDWRGVDDTDLLLSPVDDLLVFDLDADVASIRFIASAFAQGEDNTLTGSILTYAAMLDGDTVAEGDADADVLWEGTALDFEGVVNSEALVTPGVDVTALADLFGRVASDEFDVFGTLMVTVVTEDGQTHSYATDFRGNEGDFSFQFNAPNGVSAADFVWDDTGFAIASGTQVIADDLLIV